MAKLTVEQAALINEKVAKMGYKCPVCGSRELVPSGEDMFPMISPSTNEKGDYLFANAPIHYLPTYPVICKHCGFVMNFFLGEIKQ